MFLEIFLAIILTTILGAFIAIYYHFKNYVPILMYHRIADVPNDRNCVSPDKFKEQMKYLNDNGYRSISPQELYDAYLDGTKLPRKSVLITFDDGYMDNYTTALPILLRYKMTATVFPISNWIGKDNTWENFGKEATVTMDWHELNMWQKSGMQIYPHSANHPFLQNCNCDFLKKELSECRDVLREKFHSDMDFFCYPYGAFNDEVIKSARQIGYKMAFAIFENVPIWKLDLMRLPRLQISSRQPMWEFKLKISPFHILFIYMRQLERKFKRKFK